MIGGCIGMRRGGSLLRKRLMNQMSKAGFVFQFRCPGKKDH